MKIISFSVWGSNRAFVDGALENQKLAQLYYPGWSCWIYCADDVPDGDIAVLRRSGMSVCRRHRPTPDSWAGLYWRFEPAVYENVEAFISRDCDSRLNPREAAAVQEWLASGLPFHSMRDHYQHIVPMLGGMWGCRHSPWIQEELDAWTQRDLKGSDQDFLAQRVWPKIRDKCLVHDRYTVDTPIQVGGQMWTYRPKEFFGDQILRPFPAHEPLNPAVHGEHVGARVGL